MNLQNIECQLAQAQMNRYVAGDPLPEDTLQQLEKHLASCSDCRAVATEKKVTLQMKLAQAESQAESDDAALMPEEDPSEQPLEESIPIPDDAALETAPEPEAPSEPPTEPVLPAEPTAPEDEPNEAAPSPPAARSIGQGLAALIQAALARLRRKAEVAESKPPKRNLKTLAFSAGLGLVLIVMSAFASNPTVLLGPKAGPAPKEKAKEPPKPEPEPTKTHAQAETQAPPKTEPQVERRPDLDKPAAPPKSSEPEQYEIARSEGIVHAEVRADRVVATKRHETPKAPAARSAPRKPTPKQPARPRAGTGTIRVYDEHGRPMGPASGG